MRILLSRSDPIFYSDVLRLPIAALSFAKGNKPLPKALYDALVDKMHSEIEALTLLGMPASVFIPPLTAKILSKTDDSRNFPLEVLALRDKFSKFRKTYNDFLKLLKASDVTLKEKIKAKERLFECITGIIEKGEAQHALNIRTIWDKLVSSHLDEAGPSAKLSLSGLVSILLEQLSKEHIKGQARALFDLWTDTLNMKNYGELIEKAFKTEIDRKEIESFKSYSKAIRGIVRGSPQN